MPSTIDQSKLQPVEVTLRKHKHLIKVCSVGRLACKLARFAIFGEDVLRGCTPLGKADLPALPRQELAKLKDILLKQFLLYRRNLVKFEEVWESCITAIQHLCKRLRLGYI